MPAKSKRHVRSDTFVQVTDTGLDRLVDLVCEPGPVGASVLIRFWRYLRKYADHHNALFVSQDMLAKALDVSVRTIQRASADLHRRGAIHVVKVGGASVYVLNPAETWKGAQEHKRFCSFGATVLAGFDENPGLRSRVTMIHNAEREAAPVPVDRQAPGIIADARQAELVP
jgi:hypothetical protein